MKRLLLALGTAIALALPGTAAAAPNSCTTTVSSVSAAASAVSAASPGSTVCLSDGTYGRVSLNATKASPGVTLQAEHAGAATIAGASMNGTHLTVAQFRMTGSADIGVGSTGMTVDHNTFDLNSYNGYGVMACASSSTQCSDITITHNKFSGRSEEDAIRGNRYHDTADADPYGLLVEGNEFSGNQETGSHNDVFQTVWQGDGLYFRRNYLHDFGGQGFFVKDQASAISPVVVEDNLIVNQNLPCDPTSLCPTWQLSPFQVYGPIANVSMRHNTVGWGSGGGGAVLTGSYSNAVFSDNVFDDLSVTNGGGGGTVTTGTNNTRCSGGTAPAGTTTDCSPAFIDPAHGDWRQVNGRGVTWKVSDQTFGPETGVTPPPPADDDNDGVPNGSDNCPGTPAGTPVDINGCPAVTPPDDNQPVAAFTDTPDPSEQQETVTFDATSSTCADAPCTYHWRDVGADGTGDWPLGPDGSTMTFAFQGVGTKYVELVVTDADGDFDEVMHPHEVIAPVPDDTTPPQTTITSAPPSSQSTSATVGFIADEDSTFECKLDAGAYADCTSPKTYTGLSVGSHTVSVRATDTAGNTDASPASATWTVQPADQQPTARFTWSPTSPLRGQQVTFDGTTSTCGDTPCTYTWSDDGPDGPGGTNWPLGSGSTLRFTFTGAGTKYVRLTVRDADGDTSTVEHNVTVR